MAHDPNRAGMESADLSRKFAEQNRKSWEKHPLPGASDKPGSPLGFLIVVVIIALAALWIASQQ